MLHTCTVLSSQLLVRFSLYKLLYFSVVIIIIIITIIGKTKFTALIFPRLCPLVLLVKVCWRQGRGLGNKGKAMGIGLLQYAAGRNKLSI
jgi:hypothetical protein